VIDAARANLDSIRVLPAHNIRGLALSSDGEKLLISHQLLSSHAHTTVDDIHWGNLMENNLRYLQIEAVLAQDSDLFRASQVFPLGDVNEGAADPAGVIVSSEGKVVVALGGIGKVAIGSETNYVFDRVSTGEHPSELTLSADGQKVYVINAFGDSVSV